MKTRERSAQIASWMQLRSNTCTAGRPAWWISAPAPPSMPSPERDYLGGAIAPGIGIAAEALFQRAAKLPR